MATRNDPFQGPPGYVCLDNLGVGSYGEVFLVKRPIPGSEAGETEEVAIKRITDFTDKQGNRGTNRELFLRRICREICSLVHFRDCNFVVEALDVYLSQDGNDLFIVMPHYNMSMYHLFGNVEHHQLRTLLGEKHIQWMMCQVLCGLYQMHESKTMHRDMTLGNLLMNKDTFECVIADFGLSRVQLDASETVSIEVVSLPYRAPEIIFECKPYTPKLDVWSCGVILAQLLTKSSFLQLAENQSQDVSRQLYAIIDEFAGFPSKEDLAKWETKNASKMVLQHFQIQHTRAEAIRTLEAELASFASQPKVAPTAGATDDEHCAFCGTQFPDCGNEANRLDPRIMKIPAIPVRVCVDSGTFNLHGACVQLWQQSRAEKCSAAVGQACVLSRVTLDDPLSCVELVDPASGQKYSVSTANIPAWKQKLLENEITQVRKALPRDLPGPKDVAQVLRAGEAVLPNPTTGAMEHMSDAAADVIKRMLVFDPDNRADLREVLEMPWWQQDPDCKGLIASFLNLEAPYAPAPGDIENMSLDQLVDYIRSVCTITPWQ